MFYERLADLERSLTEPRDGRAGARVRVFKEHVVSDHHGPTFFFLDVGSPGAHGSSLSPDHPDVLRSAYSRRDVVRAEALGLRLSRLLEELVAGRGRGRGEGGARRPLVVVKADIEGAEYVCAEG
jgi:hypothetical protein